MPAHFLATLPNFLAYLGAAIVLLVAFVAIYLYVTPYDEIHLIRNNNTAAAISLAGAIFGFALPIANVIAHSDTLLDLAVWGVIAGIVQLLAWAVARVALEETWEYITQRQAFCQPLSAFQGVTHPLAQYDTEVEGARLLCLQGLWLKDKGLPHTAEAGMAKWWGPKLSYDVIHQCLLCFGHGGYDRGLMEQRLRDVLGFQIGDGTAQIMKTIIARARAGRKFVPA